MSKFVRNFLIRMEIKNFCSMNILRQYLKCLREHVSVEQTSVYFANCRHLSAAAFVEILMAMAIPAFITALFETLYMYVNAK